MRDWRQMGPDAFDKDAPPPDALIPAGPYIDPSKVQPRPDGYGTRDLLTEIEDR